MATSVVQPMDPLYLMSFLSKKKFDQKTIDCMVKALKKYHKACMKAAEVLDKDLKKCSKKTVSIKRSPPAK